MSFQDDLTDLGDYLDYLKASIANGFNLIAGSDAFITLTDKVVNVLTELLTILQNVIINGQPYPAADLATVHVVSDHVDLQWTAAKGNVDYQRVFRKDAVNPWAQVGPDLAAEATTFTDNTVVSGTTYQYKVVGYNYVANPAKHTYTWNHSQVAAVAFPANITANVVDSFSFVALNNGRVRTVALYLEETGADSTDPLELEADVKIGGFTVFTTKPKITKDAPDKSSTLIAGAGITQPVIDTTQNSFTLGGRIAVDLNITRTTPDTEMAGAVLEIEAELGSPSASADSNVISVDVPV